MCKHGWVYWVYQNILQKVYGKKKSESEYEYLLLTCKVTEWSQTQVLICTRGAQQCIFCNAKIILYGLKVASEINYLIWVDSKISRVVIVAMIFPD